VIDVDSLTVTARVTTFPGAPSLMTVNLEFDDPPAGFLPPGGRISLEMFDTGPNVFIGYVNVGREGIPVLSTDLVAGDGVFTRTFYFAMRPSIQPYQPLDCVSQNDRNQFGSTNTINIAHIVVDSPDASVTYKFQVEAHDQGGSIGTSNELPTLIQGTFFSTTTSSVPCGPPTGNGGCLPPSASPGSSR
jgi:hypothetical protein